MVKRLFVWIVRAYQYISSIFKTHKTCCFEPTCSQYTLEALEKHGLWKGGWLSVKRISRCHPWQKKPGYDPVPKD